MKIETARTGLLKGTKSAMSVLALILRFTEPEGTVSGPDLGCKHENGGTGTLTILTTQG